MSLAFETTFSYSRSGATTLCSLQVSETDLYVAWNDGAITRLTSLGLDYTLDQAYYFDNQSLTLPITLVKNLPTGQTIVSMTKWYDRAYAMCASGQILVIDLASNTYIGSVYLPDEYSGIGSNLCAANGRLWFVPLFNVSPVSDQNYLLSCTIPDIVHNFCASDTLTWSWDARLLLSKKQGSMRYLADGLDGRLFVTAKNDHSVLTYDTITGAYLSIYKINRHPYKLITNQNHQIYIMSDDTGAGLLSLFDELSNTASAFCALMGASWVLEDDRTGYAWLIGGNDGGSPATPTTMRIKKSTLGAVPTSAAIGIDGVLTRPLTYAKYDRNLNTTTTITIRPHLFIRGTSTVTAYRATAMKGVNSSQILGTAMIATGAQKYYGG
jgi:hypothetical protein